MDRWTEASTEALLRDALEAGLVDAQRGERIRDLLEENRVDEALRLLVRSLR